jgi:hypothetical protein
LDAEFDTHMANQAAGLGALEKLLAALKTQIA